MEDNLDAGKTSLADRAVRRMVEVRLSSKGVAARSVNVSKRVVSIELEDKRDESRGLAALDWGFLVDAGILDYEIAWRRNTP